MFQRFLTALLTLIITIGISSHVQAEEVVTWEEDIQSTLESHPQAIITIGYVDQDTHHYQVYGAEKQPYTYEIGSITKTMTAGLIEELINEGLLDLSASINDFLNLDTYDSYPTIGQLISHTSGYSRQYIHPGILKNIFQDENVYYNIDRGTVIADIESNDVGSKQADYQYSNFNYAVLSLILEAIYEDKYIHLINAYLKDLGLERTAISTEHYDLNNYERFTEDDAYLAAGQVTSNVEDMMVYLDLQLKREHPVLVNDITDYQESQAIGYAWHFHDQGIIWHNGATNHYNAFMAFHPPSQQGIVVLINLPVDEGVSATSIGQEIILSQIENQN